MNFVENIIHRLKQTPDRAVLQEVRDGKIVSATCAELLSQVQTARAFLRAANVKRGDRAALLANNSINWAAIDLALMAEGIIVVPLYARQAPDELVGMMKDAGVSFVCCGDEALRQAVAENWADAPTAKLFDEIIARRSDSIAIDDAPIALADEDAATIIYTSGTSGEPKGSDTQRRQRYLHARLHERAARPVDGQAAGAGRGLSLPAVLFRGIVDTAFDLSVARQPAHDVYGFEQARGRDEAGRAQLFFERAGAAWSASGRASKTSSARKAALRTRFIKKAKPRGSESRTAKRAAWMRPGLRWPTK